MASPKNSEKSELSSINGLKSVFNKFSASISNVYNFTYVRNQQAVPGSSPVKLKFVIKAKKKSEHQIQNAQVQDQIFMDMMEQSPMPLMLVDVCRLG